MEALRIESTEFTPAVKFDPESHIFEIEGVSRPENVMEFYSRINDWITDYESYVYKQNVSGGKKFTIQLNFKFSYFNSASSKMIYIFLESIFRINAMGFKVNINWYYDEGDDQMMEDGEELSEAIDIPFEFIES